MAQELAILSPEKSVLTYRLAGVGSRLIAHLLDLCIVCLVIVAMMMVGSLLASVGIDLSILLLPILPLTVMFYFVLCEWLWNGSTIGKKAAGIRVCMQDGRPITFEAALARNLIRPADMVPGTYMVGIIAMFTNPRSQRLGDLFARTIVVYAKRAEPIFRPAPHVMGVHPLESFVGDLRGMTSEEYVVLRRFCDRFPELPTTVQTRLMQEVWRPIALRRGVKPLNNVHEIYLAEAVVMKYGRIHGLL
jgi:uncharacterized RDD family membrane protein YckC